MDWFKFIIAIGVLLACGSIAFYFLFALPGIKNSELYLKEKQYNDQRIAAQDRQIDLNNCLNDAYSSSIDHWNESCKTHGVDSKNPECSLPQYVVDDINKNRDKNKSDCFKQFPQN